jgi:hypothetical protein
MWGLLIQAALGAYQASEAKKQGKVQKKAEAARQRSEDERLAMARRSEAKADEADARYKAVFQPIQDDLIREARRPINPDVQAGQAISDTEGQLATARGALTRNLGRRGINPADGAVIDAEARLALAGGKARAAAGTMARRQAVADREGRLLRAAGLGSNLPGIGLNYASMAGSGLSDVLNSRSNEAAYQRWLSQQSGDALGGSLAGILTSAPEGVTGGLGMLDRFQNKLYARPYSHIGPQTFMPQIDTASYA